MERNYPHDRIDGRSVPPLVVEQDYRLRGVHEGTVHVEAGTFTLDGTNKGTLAVHPTAVAVIVGKQQGTVNVAAGAVVTVRGAIAGTTSIAPDATVIVEHGARLAGTLHNDGLLIVRGAFGGVRSGIGELRLEGAGYIKQPESVRNGIAVYDWSRDP